MKYQEQLESSRISHLLRCSIMLAEGPTPNASAFVTFPVSWVAAFFLPFFIYFIYFFGGVEGVGEQDLYINI